MKISTIAFFPAGTVENEEDIVVKVIIDPSDSSVTLLINDEVVYPGE